MAKNAKKNTSLKNGEKLNNLTVLFLMGCVMETYLLIIYKMYVRGTGPQMLFIWEVLTYMPYFGAALALVGTLLCRKMKGRRVNWGLWMIGTGLFLLVSTVFSRQVHSYGAILFCAIVPITMLLAVIYKLYTGEFFWSALSLTMGIGWLWIWRRSFDYPERRIIAFVILGLILATLALAAWFTHQAGQNKGWVTLRGKRRQMISAYGDRPFLYAVYALCAAAPAAAVFMPTLAYYGMYALGAVLFAAAIYYTVKAL